MITNELLNSYKATCYSIIEPEIDIYVQEENSLLNTFLESNNFKTWCFITAWNPFSESLTTEENISLNELLKADLVNYPFFHAIGKDTLGVWPPEVSFFVANISKETSISLGKKYQQNALVFGKVNELSELIILVR